MKIRDNNIMFEIIAGNIFAIGAMISDSCSGTKKSRKSMLLTQSISQVFYFSANFVLKGYSACVQNSIAIVRNLFAAFNLKGKYIEYVIVGLPVILGFYFNNLDWLGYLPIVANLQYSLCVFRHKENHKILKISFIINSVFFIIFNFAILNFVSGIAAIVIVITTSISLYKENKSETSK